MINLNLMKKLKKSTWVTLALLIYVSVTAAYLLPRNTEVSDTEKYITLAISYVIVFILWLVYKRRSYSNVVVKKSIIQI